MVGGLAAPLLQLLGAVAPLHILDHQWVNAAGFALAVCGPVDLIDGNRLCKLLKANAIGVTTTQRTVGDVKVESDYFASLEPK